MSVRWEVVHIFISSTFTDMHAERDYLVKHVFPELREWCEKRKLRLVDIDLRWGVTEQDATSQNVVKVCLDRIDECRPFFICFLGQRRGWVPNEEEISPVTKTEFPALMAYGGKASVTELEIVHALVNPLHRGRVRDEKKPGEFYEPSKYAFFYLRENAYLDQLPHKPLQLRQIYTNEGVENEDDRLHQDRQLKHWREVEIPATKRPVRNYQAHWDTRLSTPELLLPLQCPSREAKNIKRWQEAWQKAGVTVTGMDVEANPSQIEKARVFNRLLSTGRLTDFQSGNQPLRQVIVADLQEAIAARYPEHMEAVAENNLQRELDQQELFLFQASQGFIERQGDFDVLDDYVKRISDRPFVLTAPGGMGKSSLLATWVERCRARLEGQAGASLHYRFIGQSDFSTTVTALLGSLAQELKEAGKTSLDIPDDPGRLRREFVKMLAEAGGKGPTILILDALNQLESGLSDLAWLPFRLPKNVRLVVSFKTNAPQADSLLQRLQGKAILAEVRPFASLDDRRALVERYLEQYLKQLDPPLLEALVQSIGAANPLYFKVVLSELRVFGAFPNLGEKIRSDFGETPITAFLAVLNRLENDPGISTFNPKRTLPLIFGLLAHARHGLSVTEWVDLLVKRLSPRGEWLDRQAVADTLHMVLRQLRPFLAQREGRYDFFFESFQQAARQKYTGGQRPAQYWHTHLAEYFLAQPIMLPGAPGQANRRKLAEQAYHLVFSQRWEELDQTLTDYPFLEAKARAFGPNELVADYDLLESQMPEAQSRPLLLISDALRLSSQALHLDAHLLAGQLLGRLRGLPYAAIQRLLQGAERKADSPWLCPQTKSLRSPGSALQTSLAGHAEEIIFLRVFHNEERAVSASKDKTIKVWDLKQGQALATFKMKKPIQQVVADPECHHLLAVDEAGMLAAWDLDTFTEITRQDLSEQGICTALAIAPAAGLAACALDTGQVCLLDLERPRKSWSITAKGLPAGAEIEAISLATGSSAVAWVENDGARSRLVVYDLAEDRQVLQEEGKQFLLTPDGERVVQVGLLSLELAELSAHELDWHKLGDPDRDGQCALAPGGRWLITSTRIFDLWTGELLGTFPASIADVERVAVMPDSSQVIYQEQGCLQMFEPRDPEPGYITVAEEPAPVLDLLPMARRVIGATRSHKIHLWSLAGKAAERYRSLLGHQAPILDIVADRACQKVISGAADGQIILWDARTGKDLFELKGHKAAVRALALSKDERWLVSAGWDQRVLLWDLQGKAAPRRLEGHASPALCAAISHSGELVASGGKDGRVLLWDMKRQKSFTLSGHTAEISRVLITPDEKQVISASEDGTLRVWDARSGAALFTLSGHENPVSWAALSPDGSRLFSASDGSLKAWDLKRRSELLSIPHFMFAFVQVTADGRQVVAGSDQIRMWDLTTGALRFELKPEGALAALALAPGGEWVAYATLDSNEIYIHNVQTGLRQAALSGHVNEITCLRAGPEGRWILSGSEDCSVILWELENYYEIEPAGKDALIAALAHHPAAKESGYQVDDLEQLLESELFEYESPDDFLAAHPEMALAEQVDDDHLVALRGSLAEIWELAPETCHPGFMDDDSLTTLQVIPEFERLVCKSKTGAYHCFEVRLPVKPAGPPAVLQPTLPAPAAAPAVPPVTTTVAPPAPKPAAPPVTPPTRPPAAPTPPTAAPSERTLQTLHGHTSRVTAVSIDLEGRLALSGSWDQTVKLWDVETGACLRTFEGHKGSIYAVCWSEDGARVLSGSDDKTLKLWEVESGKCLQTFTGHAGSVSAVCVSANGRFALSGSSDGTLKLWDVHTGRYLRTCEGHTRPVAAACLAPDGRHALSASRDKTLILWDMTNGAAVRVFRGHQEALTCAALSADGRLAISGSEDETLKLWDLESGACLRTFEKQDPHISARRMSVGERYSLEGGEIVWDVCLSTDGGFAISTGADHKVKVWELETGRCVKIVEADISCLALSADGTFCLCSRDKAIQPWTVGLKPRQQPMDDWQASARPMMERFLDAHTPPAEDLPPDRAPNEQELAQALLQRGEAQWKDRDFERLMLRLQYAGYRGLGTADVQRALELLQASQRAEAASSQAAFDQALAQARQALDSGQAATAARYLRQARGQPGGQKAKEVEELWFRLYTRLPRKSPIEAREVKLFTGHTGDVNGVFLSADRRYALSGSNDKTLKLWETDSGKCLRTFEGESGRIFSVGLSADGTVAISGGESGLKLWDVESGRCLRTFEGDNYEVRSVCLSVDGHLALSGSNYDKTIKLWEVDSGLCLRTLEGHLAGVNSVCLSADDRYILSGSADKTLKLWELATGRCLSTLRGHAEGVSAVYLSADCRIALSSSHDNTLKLWDLESGSCLRTFRGMNTGNISAMNSVCLSADGCFAISDSRDNKLKLWEIESSHCLYTLDGHKDEVLSVVLSSDGYYVLSGSMDKRIKLWQLNWELEDKEPADWDEGARPYLEVFLMQHTPYAGILPRDRMPTDEEITLALTRHGEPVWSEMDFQNLLHTLGCAGYGWLRPEGVRSELEKMKVYQKEADKQQSANQAVYDRAVLQARQALESGQVAAAVGHLRQARSLAGFQRAKEALELWSQLYTRLPHKSFQGGWEVACFEGHTKAVCSVFLSADGRYAISGSDNKSLKLWELANGRCLRTFEGHRDRVFSVCLSPAGHFALSGSNDKTLKQWDVESGRCLRTFEGHKYGVSSVCLSSGGEYALSGSMDKTIKLWEMESGRCLHTLTGHKDIVRSVCLSADGRYALSGSDDKTLKLWELKSGRCLRTFEGHIEWVSSVCLSHDGAYALSGSLDKTFKLWEVESGCCLHTFEEEKRDATAMSLSESLSFVGKVGPFVWLSFDGRYALSISRDKSLKLWELESRRCLHNFTADTKNIISACLSQDGRYILAANTTNELQLWQLDWELEDREPADWDEGARPYLEVFLTTHTSSGGLFRGSKTAWTEQDFQSLLYTLGCAGYGWLRPEGVRQKLAEMVKRQK